MEVITNEKGKETFSKKLSPLVSWCEEAYIVTAFFTDDSWIGRLDQEGKSVKLVVSLRPPTKPEALERIINLKNVQVKFLCRELHSKIYAFSKGDENSWYNEDFEFKAAVGSSNMTISGFENNIETNVMLDGKLAHDAFEQARQIFNNAFDLTADVLERYIDECNRYQESIFPEIHESREKLSNEYERIVHAVKYIARLCGSSIDQSFPGVPHYLVVDNFWDYLVVNRRADKQAIMARAKSHTTRDRLIIELFNDYLNAECNKASRYPDEMFSRSRVLSDTLQKKSLSADDMKAIFRTFHASLYAEQTYGDKLKEFMDKNEPKKVLNSLTYLGNEEVDIEQRLYDLQREPRKVKGFGESTIREFNGWLYPNKYPIWNTKSERALEILGFG
ncbi:phospholipase D family protein [Vibrio campbellii]|uniref:phospholipase D family protein n=1 Tax=Vibrio campbellii TaxID=680 RepID=UPI0038CDBAF8